MPNKHILRLITEPIRENQSWDDDWAREDKGLIACWERGRVKSKEDPNLALLAQSGELVILPWKGGVEKAIKTKHKYGSLSYLAMWQGLRGENLDIHIDKETKITCSRTNMNVIYTSDQTKYSEV